MSRPFRSFVLLLIVALMAAAGTDIWRGLRSLDAPLNVAVPLRFKVALGTGFARVAADLATRAIVARPYVWVLYARWTGVARSIKAGEYEITPGMTPRQLLQKMANGQVFLHSLTIVDGWRVRDLLLALRRDPDILTTLPANASLPEGEFLPETYRFPSGMPDVDLLRQAHAALTRVLDAAWSDRDPTLPLRDANELLILASIVQKESGLPAELPKIAGLYLHRLSIGMRLQADPSVIYGLGEAYGGDLRSVDLRADGPYNTYTRTGLPPTAIALPGAAAITATAHPERTDALYFVASGKGDGSHVFSGTLEQHNIAVAHYLVRQRQKAASDRAR